MRAIWSGSISFGLVNIPVKVVTAVRPKDIQFHMLHGKDGARIRFRRVCPKEDVEVPNDEIVRGYEVGRNEYVTFTDKELQGVDPKAARTIEVSEFVAQADIDPVYYEKPYYLVPDKNADRSYALLLAALRESGKVAIARVVMREKEHLVAVRPRGGALVMATLHFADEVVDPAVVTADLNVPAKVDARQLKLAEELIGNLSRRFDPALHRDTHRERVLAIVEAKLKGHKVVHEPAAPPARTTDIMAALESSLANVRGKTSPPKVRRKASPQRTRRARPVRKRLPKKAV